MRCSDTNGKYSVLSCKGQPSEQSWVEPLQKDFFFFLLSSQIMGILVEIVSTQPELAGLNYGSIKSCRVNLAHQPFCYSFSIKVKIFIN